MQPKQLGPAGVALLAAIVGLQLAQAAHISEPNTGHLAANNGNDQHQQQPNVISASPAKLDDSSGDLSHPMKTLQRQALGASGGGTGASDSDKLKRGIMSVFRKSSPGNFFVPTARSAHSTVAQLPIQHQQHPQQHPQQQQQPATQQISAQQQQQQQQPASQPSGEPSANLVGGAETTGDLLNRQNRLKPNGSLFRWGRR